MKFTDTHPGSFETAFSYIFEKNYVSIRDEGSKMLNTDKYNINCPCENMPNENIHSEGHIIKYLDTQYNIVNLAIGKILLGDLGKVGWVV